MTSVTPLIAVCQHCGEGIKLGEPYMAPIPFVGTWGGLIHRHCRPRLTLIRGGQA